MTTDDHEQATLTTPAGELVEVDAGLKTMLAGLWGLGITTQHSCQGGGEAPAYVAFADLESGDRFARLVQAKKVPGRRMWVWLASADAFEAEGLSLAVYFPSEAIDSIERAIAGQAFKDDAPRRVRALRSITDKNLHTGKIERFAKRDTVGRVEDVVEHADGGLELLVSFKGAPHATCVFLGEHVKAA